MRLRSRRQLDRNEETSPISKTVLRVPRCRIYLVLYGGVGLSIVVSAILRLTVVREQVRIAVSSDGIRAATGIVAFWIIAGLRMAFISPGNQQGNLGLSHRTWQASALPRCEGAIGSRQGMGTPVGTHCHLRGLPRSPAELLTLPATASQLLVAAGMCLLLTDILFLNVKIVAFSGERAREQSGLLATLLGATAARIAKDRSIFGALLETFVFSEIEKQVSWMEESCSLHHYRDKDQDEVDIVVEDGSGGLVGIEVKASATVNTADFKGLRKMAVVCGDDFKLGLVLYDRERAVPFGNRLFAAPISSLWG